MSALAGLLLGAALAVVQAPEERAVTAGEVTLEACFTWPDGLSHGYYPIRVELSNGGEDEAAVRVRARQLFRFDEVEKRLTLAPGERRSFDLPCRVESYGSNEYALELEVGGQAAEAGTLGADEARSSHRPRALLALAEERPAAAEFVGWEAALAIGELALSGAGFEDMPEDPACWSSLDAVLLDTRGGLPPAERLAPLVAYARLGGTLVLHGERASTEALGGPSIAAWCEPRFRVLEDPPLAASVYAFGQGRLVLIDAPTLFERQGEAAFLAAQLARGVPPWTPGAEDSRSVPAMPEGSPVAELPLRALVAILVLFAVLIGPVNFYVVKRMARPVQLLITVPGLALACAALLLGYGLLSQGLDVKVVRHSFTLLDQRLRQASTADLQRVFAGSSPGAGLRPGPGSAVFAPVHDDPYGVFRRERQFRVDLTGGPLFAGDYLPVRQAHPLVTLTDAPARGRLEVGGEGEALDVANGLGAELRWVVLRDAAGGWHALDEPLAPGASATLQPVDEGEGRMWSGRVVERLFPGGPPALPPGSYAGELARSPFVDDCGVERTELLAQHWLLGVLEAEGEAR